MKRNQTQNVQRVENKAPAINGCVYLQAERMAKQSVEQGLITRFQVAEYLKEYYQQATGSAMSEHFNTDAPKDFFRRWNGAKRASIKEYKQYQARKAELSSVKVHLSDVAPTELLIAQQLRKLRVV